MTKRPPIGDWLAEDGDNNAALNWPIDESSIVLEIGGYKGRWALQMAEKYNPRLYICEPQPWALDRTREKLKGYNAKVFPVALWTHPDKMEMAEWETDGASLLKPYDHNKQWVDTVDVFAFFNEQFGDEEIDVCLMNIEGGEFVLLPYMIGLGLLSKIKYFWMQLHTFAPYSGEKIEALDEMLAKTHDIWWDYRVAATCWRRRD